MGGSAASRTTSGSCSSGPRARPAGRWSPRRAWPTTAAWSRRAARTAPRWWSGSGPARGWPSRRWPPAATRARHWTPGLLDADLADVPDAMAVAPSGQTLALLQRRRHRGGAERRGGDRRAWSRLTTLSALAASTPGRGCGLVAVNAVSFGPDNVPMAAGSCLRRGVAGVFADAGGTWQAAGPVLPAGFGGDQVQVLGLAAAPRRQRGAAAGRDRPAGGLVGRGALDGLGAGRGGRGERVGVRAGRRASGCCSAGAGRRPSAGRADRGGRCRPCQPGTATLAPGPGVRV